MTRRSNTAAGGQPSEKGEGIDVMPSLKLATADVERVCELLISPSPAALDHCCGLLETAAKNYQRWSAQPASHCADGLAEAIQLRKGLKRAGLLLEKAAGFHADWQNIITAVEEGYSAGDRRNGYPAARAARLSFQA